MASTLQERVWKKKNHLGRICGRIYVLWLDRQQTKKFDDERYVLRFSPRKTNSLWSKINKERAEMLIKSGKMTAAGMAKIAKAKKNGFWDNAYTNKTKEAIPLDLKEALMDDEKAWENFQNFANSNRNMYIGWVNNAKTTETRRKRIEKIVEQSMPNKKLIFDTTIAPFR